jgi:hypothetical protein
MATARAMPLLLLKLQDAAAEVAVLQVQQVTAR